MAQTDFNQYTPVGRVGALAALECRNITSAPASSKVPFGNVVVYDGIEGESVSTVANATAGSPVAGISLAVQNSHKIGEVSNYEGKGAVSIVRQGVVWMKANGPVSIGDPVYYITESDATAPNGEVGATETAGGATANTLLEGAKFSSSALDGELVKVTLNLP